MVSEERERKRKAEKHGGRLSVCPHRRMERRREGVGKKEACTTLPPHRLPDSASDAS